MIEPASDHDFRVIDLHTHPTLKMAILNTRFWRSYFAPSGTYPWTMRTNIHSLIKGNVKCVMSSVYVPERGLIEHSKRLTWLPRIWRGLGRQFKLSPEEAAHVQLDLLERQVKKTRRRLGDIVEIATDYARLQTIMGEGKVAIVNSLEGAHHLNGDLAAIDRFAARGVAHLIIAHLVRNEACGCVDGMPDHEPLKRMGLLRVSDQSDSGLTAWGYDLVNKMWDTGMIVDMTHATPLARQQILDEAAQHSKRRPVIMSHVGVHALAPFAMNPTDEEIRRIADTGGVIGLIAMPWWLSKPRKSRCVDVLKQSIDHLIQHGGEGVVAFGSDFDGFTTVPRDWRSPKDYPRLQQQLSLHFSSQQIEDFFSRNPDRVLRDGWDNHGRLPSGAGDSSSRGRRRDPGGKPRLQGHLRGRGITARQRDLPS